MIGARVKELPVSIVIIVFSLLSIGLVVLKSISFHHQGSFMSNPFNKQIIFLIPAISIAMIIIGLYFIFNPIIGEDSDTT